MKNSHTFKCDACGASSVSQQSSHPVFECQYCGSSVLVNIGQQPPTQTSKTKLSLLLIAIPLLVITLMVVFWLVFQNVRVQNHLEQNVPDVSNRSALNHVRPQTQSQPELQKAYAADEDPRKYLSISSQFTAETSSGGLYWVVGVTNNGEHAIHSPGAVISLFDAKGQRVAEQSGWSSHKILEPGKTTAVLVFLPQPPDGADRHELAILASKPNQFNLQPLPLRVQDYVISAANDSFEIIGDVINDHDRAVKYARVFAVAKNSNKEPIGLGNAFATQKNLKAGENSGFKIKVGTFLVGKPDHWELWSTAQ